MTSPPTQTLSRACPEVLRALDPGGPGEGAAAGPTPSRDWRPAGSRGQEGPVERAQGVPRHTLHPLAGLVGMQIRQRHFRRQLSAIFSFWRAGGGTGAGRGSRRVGGGRGGIATAAGRGAPRAPRKIGKMFQIPVQNLDNIRKVRKRVKGILVDIGLDSCKELLKALNQERSTFIIHHGEMFLFGNLLERKRDTEQSHTAAVSVGTQQRCSLP